MNSYKLTFVSITIVLLFGCQRKIISASKIDNEIVTGKKVPVVASKYGFRKELIGGKYFLVPLSREDYDKFVAAWTKNPENKGIKFRTSQEIEASCYMYTTYACASSDGCQMCVLRNVSNYYFCECVQL